MFFHEGSSGTTEDKRESKKSINDCREVDIMEMCRTTTLVRKRLATRE